MALAAANNSPVLVTKKIGEKDAPEVLFTDEAAGPGYLNGALDFTFAPSTGFDAFGRVAGGSPGWYADSTSPVITVKSVSYAVAGSSTFVALSGATPTWVKPGARVKVIYSVVRSGDPYIIPVGAADPLPLSVKDNALIVASLATVEVLAVQADVRAPTVARFEMGSDSAGSAAIVVK